VPVIVAVTDTVMGGVNEIECDEIWLSVGTSDGEPVCDGERVHDRVPVLAVWVDDSVSACVGLTFGVKLGVGVTVNTTEVVRDAEVD